MNFIKHWFSPLVAACMLFLAGIIFGIGAPLSFSTPSVSIVLDGMTAFGTVLIGIAAILGVNAWREQESSKRLARVYFELHEGLKNHISELQQSIKGFSKLAPYERNSHRVNNIIFIKINKIKELLRATNFNTLDYEFSLEIKKSILDLEKIDTFEFTNSTDFEYTEKAINITQNMADKVIMRAIYKS